MSVHNPIKLVARSSSILWEEGLQWAVFVTSGNMFLRVVTQGSTGAMKKCSFTNGVISGDENIPPPPHTHTHTQLPRADFGPLTW
jgi:hypothetical protein